VRDVEGARADLLRGQKHFAAGEMFEARVAFEAAIAKDSGFAQAHFWRGRACVVTSKEMSYSHAIESFSRALALDPALVEAHWGMGIAHMGYADADAAGREFRAFLAGATDRHAPEMRGEAEHFLGVLARQQGDLDGALAHFARAQELHPRFSDTPYERGLALEKAGRREEAAAAFAAAIAIDADHLPSHFRLSRLLRELGREEQASRHERIHRILSLLSEDATGRTVRAPERRAELFGELAGLDPANVRARLEYARALVELQRVDEAALVLDELVRAAPRFAPGYVARAELALGMKDERKARETVDALARALPELAVASLPASLHAFLPKR